jgi:hypothetical protein
VCSCFYCLCDFHHKSITPTMDFLAQCAEEDVLEVHFK